MQKMQVVANSVTESHHMQVVLPRPIAGVDTSERSSLCALIRQNHQETYVIVSCTDRMDKVHNKRSPWDCDILTGIFINLGERAT